MEQYSLYGALRAKGLIKLKSRLPVILHTMIMIILSQKSITHIPRYMVGESPNRDVVGIMLPLRMLLFKNTFIIRKKVSIIKKIHIGSNFIQLLTSQTHQGVFYLVSSENYCPFPKNESHREHFNATQM